MVDYWPTLEQPPARHAMCHRWMTGGWSSSLAGEKSTVGQNGWGPELLSG